jgi:hypothetical protein
MHTAPSFPLLKHPLAEAVLRFVLLPSQFLHPRRAPQRESARLPQLKGLDRHSSAALLKQHHLDPVVDLQDPVLPLAMLPQDSFDRIGLLLGAALNAPHIRRTIVREQLSTLKSQLGPEALNIARSDTAEALRGLPVAPDWQAPEARVICQSWGCAILGQAFEAASEPVAARARLRLAPEADALRVPLAAADLQPQRALDIARALLGSLEPAWLSSFPSTP